MNALLRSIAWTAVAAVLIASVPARSRADSAATATRTTNKDEELAALRRRVEQQDRLIQQILSDNLEMKKRLDRIEQGATTPPANGKPTETPTGEPEVPPIALPGTVPPAQPLPSGAGPAVGASAVPTARAVLTPDISVIGNNLGRFLSVRGDSYRNRPFLGELEIAMEQPVYSGIKFRATLAASSEGDFGVGAEEAHVLLTQPGGLPVSGWLGKKRMEFGKINSVHPHARPYADSPAVVTNLLGPDGLNGNGLTVGYLLPLKSAFANVQLGYVLPEGSDLVSQASPESPAYPVGMGVSGNLKTARVWVAPDLRAGKDLEIGATHGWGKDANGDSIGLTGLDLTYKAHPTTFSKWMLQSEVLWHTRRDGLGLTGSHTRSGHYALLQYSPTQYRDYGLRYDCSRFPWPIRGRDQSVSLIWTNRLAEATIMRLQYKYGDRTSDLVLPVKRGYSELYLQFIWGAGSHSHPLN